MTSDLFVLSRIRGGDIRQFEQVFRLYYSPLCLYATGITGSRDISEEIVQDLFYVFWKEREKLRVFYSLRGYLYRSVRNRALQYCEHREVVERHRDAVLAAGEAYGAPSATPQEMLEYKELENLINRTLHKLPARRLRIFRMHRFEGKKYMEIASLLSISVKTVEAEMTKALQILRKEIDNYTHIA